MALILDWSGSGATEEGLRALVEALLQGNLVILPTESGYIVAGDGDHPGVVDRLAGLATGSSTPLSRLIPFPSMIKEYSGSLSSQSEKILDRLGPGSLGIQTHIEAKSESPSSVALTSEGRLRFRHSVHNVLDTLWLTGRFRSLVISERVHSANEEETALSLAETWNDAIAVVVNMGPLIGKPITWVFMDASSWSIVQAGSVADTAIVNAAATWIVFVCTGNTCRSPMAEALTKTRLTERLGCTVEELPARGYWIQSAGVAAYPGDGPTPEAVEVLRSAGIDLSAHRSQPLAPETVAHTDHLIGMTRSHLVAVLSRYPRIGGSLRLLCGARGDLDDPIGGGPEVYAQCAAEIEIHVNRLLRELIDR